MPAIGILMALHERHRTGQGQAVDVSLYDCAVSLLHPHAANYLMSGKPPQRDRQRASEHLALRQLHAPATKPIFLAVGNDRQFERLCGELGAPDLAKDKRFLKNADRVTNRDALKAEIERLLANHDSARLADTPARASACRAARCSTCPTCVGRAAHDPPRDGREGRRL